MFGLQTLVCFVCGHGGLVTRSVLWDLCLFDWLSVCCFAHLLCVLLLLLIGFNFCIVWYVAYKFVLLV